MYGLKHTSPFVLNNKITAFCHLIFKTLSPLSVSGAENAFALASNACHAQMGSNAKTHFLKNNLLFMLLIIYFIFKHILLAQNRP
ncbi:MAG: hypothetical protein OSJ28_03595, partial [Desulfovibrio sp.]|nr:hypothetical protein [Desulfovibrio sp.]